MVYAGLTLYDARYGGRVTFDVTAADSDGALLSTTSVLSTGFPRPPLHVHPHQTEHFAVRRGRLRVTRGRRVHLLGPGEELEVAPGTPHTFAVEGPDEVEVRVNFVPAGDMEGFLVAMAGLARDGGLTDRGRPRLLPVTAVAQRHAGDVRLACVPARAQDLALALLAWLRSWPGEARVPLRRRHSEPAKFGVRTLRTWCQQPVAGQPASTNSKG